MGEVHPNHIETGYQLLSNCSSHRALDSSHTLSQHGDLLNRVGLWAYQSSISIQPSYNSAGQAPIDIERTNGANNACPTMVLLRLVIDVQITLPLHLRAVGEVVESVAHFLCLFLFFSTLSRYEWWLDCKRAVGCGGRYFNGGLSSAAEED